MRHDDERNDQKPLTRLVRTGRDASINGPFVNPPVVHASTVLFEDVASMQPGRQKYGYGRELTPTIEALALATAELDGAAGAVLCPSGLSAVSAALLAVLGAGDHLLLADNVYDPARRFATSTLARLGVETTFFDPAIGGAIEAMVRPNTRAIYVETPGSLTFEMTDLPAIASVAAASGALVIADNTWATPLYFKPLAKGADIALQAGTKYLGGHSDLMLGVVTANEQAWERLKETHRSLGLCAGPDDIYLALRGLRTLGVRLERHRQSAIEVANWLADHPAVTRVLHPALPTDPGHALWRRDMTGSSGLFGIVLRGWSQAKVAAFLDGLTLFGLGYSWGGYESLAIPARITRTASKWRAEDAVIRIHVGLEDVGDLIADLDAAFDRVRGLA